MSNRQQKKIRKIYNEQLNAVAKKDFDLYNRVIVGKMRLYQWLALVMGVCAVVLAVIIVVLVGVV